MKFLVLALCVAAAFAACNNGCSGHGTCLTYDQCQCDLEDKTTYFGYQYDGYKGYDRLADGSSSVSGQVYAQLRSAAMSQDDTDEDKGAGARYRSLSKTSFVQAAWQGPDCSLKTCPRGVSWTQRHAEDVNLHADFAECSDRGLCNTGTGVCECQEGYEGEACQRTTCPSGCSQRGICVSNLELAQAADGYVSKDYVSAWDTGNHFGCLCETGYRGEACELKECPSTADPEGGKGNSEGRDCSGRGLCDYATGMCECFSGYKGHDCSGVTVLY